MNQVYLVTANLYRWLVGQSCERQLSGAVFTRFYPKHELSLLGFSTQHQPVFVFSPSPEITLLVILLGMNSRLPEDVVRTAIGEDLYSTLYFSGVISGVTEDGKDDGTVPNQIRRCTGLHVTGAYGGPIVVRA